MMIFVRIGLILCILGNVGCVGKSYKEKKFGDIFVSFAWEIALIGLYISTFL